MSYFEEAKKLKPETRKEFAKRQLQEDYRRSLGLFAKDLLGYKDLNNRTHGDVIRALQAPTKRKLIVMPRGTFKSSLCSVAYPMWLLIRDPNERVLIDSELYGNAKNFLREIKLHFSADPFKELFGDYRSDTVWNEGEIIISKRTKIFKEASITASGIGSERTSQHFSTIIADDLNSPSNSATPEGRQKVIDHWRYNTSLLEPNGTMILVGTRYASNDAIGYCLENEIDDKPLGLI